MIKDLSIHNFKGATASYTFGRGNLIHGENFAGKSAIDQAIRYLVLGYIPGVAKTAAGIKMFASDYPMQLQAVIAHNGPDDGHYRVAFEKRGSTVKQTCDDTMAAVIDEPTRVLFDPTAFFGLSDSARISKACELVQGAGMKADDIDAALTAQIGDNPAMLRHLATWRTTIKAKAASVPDLLTDSEAFWKAERKVVNADKDRMQSTVEGVSDLHAADAEPLPARATVEADKQKLVERLREIDGRLAACTALAKAMEADQRRMDEIRPLVLSLDPRRAKVQELVVQLDELEKDHSAASDAATRARLALDEAQKTEATIAAAVKRYAELRVQADLAPAIQRSISETEGAIDFLRAKATQLRASAVELETQAKAIRAEAEAPKPDRATGELRTDDFESNAQPDVRYLVTAVVQRTNLEAHSITEILSIEDWKPIIENVDELEESARAEECETAQRLAEADDAADEAQRLESETERQLDNELGQLVELQESLTRANVAAEALASLPVLAPAIPDVAALRTYYTATAEAAMSLRNRKHGTREALSDARLHVAKAESAEAELAALEAKPARKEWEQRDPAAIDSLKAQQLNGYADLNSFDALLQRIAADEQDQKRILEAAQRRAEVEAQAKLLGKVLDLVSQKKTELVSVSIEAPLAVANKLATGILKGPLVFEEGEIGMRVGDAFISSRVFSGTETALVIMGLTAGLAAASSLRVLILDEFGRLTTKNAVRLMSNLHGMVVAGTIDQFFLIGPTNEALVIAAPGHDISVISL